MKFAALFLASLLVSTLTAHAAPQLVIESGPHEPVVELQSRKDIEGLASAGSTYVDGKVKTPTVGSASVVRLEKGYAVLTAAHVVAGTKPWVEIGKKRISPKSVWIDCDSDVALLDIGKGPFKAALMYGTGKLEVENTFMQGIIDDKFPIVMIAYYHPGHALGFALRPWVDAGVESAYTRSIVRAPIISQSGDGRMIRVNTKITSGASGSAVFDLSTKAVTGLVVESHYYFSETYLASAQVLVQHFQKFIEGKRGFASNTQWLMHNQLTYRHFADGTIEANFVKHPTSGILGQPGNGIIGQPGNGIIGQPAHEKQFQPWSQDPRSVFQHFGVEPGLIWKDKSVYAFSVKNKGQDASWPARFNMLAEPEGIRYLEDHPDRFEFEPLKDDVDYIELLRQRVGMKPSEKSQSLTPVYGPNAVVNSYEMWSANGISADITNDKVHVKIQVYSKMDRTKWNLVKDELEFTLGKNGAPLGQAHFMPVIEAKGLISKETYYVDVRPFFFVDYSQLLQPIDGWSRENAPFEFSRFDMARQIRMVSFSVRNANSGAEFSYGFGSSDLAPAPETN